ncbi:MAG: efflux RND transporter permease subunit, partial [Candidatus Omnitrophota bacterium]
MRLPEFGVKYPITNLMIFAAVLVISLFSLTRLGIDLMPEIEPPAISVITVCPGASPEDVETRVTRVLENQLATTPYLEKLQSRSSEELSIVTVKFLWGTNLDEASNDIRDRIELAKRTLPDIPNEIENPRTFKFNTALIPIVFVGASADESYPALYHMIDKKILDQLKTIPGIGTVFAVGGLERQINIWVDRAKLEARHLSIQDVAVALARENITLPAGSLKMGLTDYAIRVPGEFQDPSQMKDIIITTQGDAPVYLKDIAEVQDGFKEEKTEVRMNGRRGLMVLAQKQSGTNTVAVANKIKKKIRQLEKNLPPDVKLDVIFDTSEHIVLAINNLKNAVYWGGIFVILVVYFFLRQIRPSLIVALTIPFSLLISFIFFFLFGYTINIISLSSLAIAIGMVVDNAIVVVDNVSRHRERGEDPKEGTINGASEVGLAISASTLTTVVVFVPMMFIKGVVGIMFRQLAVIVTVTLLASLFTALTFSPTLCSKWLIDRPKKKRNPVYEAFYNFSKGIFDSLEKRYAGLLGWSLGHKKFTIFCATAIFIGSLFLIPLIGTEFV